MASPRRALRRTPGRERELREVWETIGHSLLPSPTCPDGHGDTLADAYRSAPGTRPWAFWFFELGRQPPATPMDQLRELAASGRLLGSWEQKAAERYICWRAVHQVRADPTAWRIKLVADDLGVSPAQVSVWLKEEGRTA